MNKFYTRVLRLSKVPDERCSGKEGTVTERDYLKTSLIHAASLLFREHFYVSFLKVEQTKVRHNNLVF